MSAQKPVEEELQKLSSHNAEHANTVQSIEQDMVEHQEQLDALQCCLQNCKFEIAAALLPAGNAGPGKVLGSYCHLLCCILHRECIVQNVLSSLAD